jgi:hypothetical protein
VVSFRSKSEGRAWEGTVQKAHRIGTDIIIVMGNSFDKHSHISRRYECLYSTDFIDWASLVRQKTKRLLARCLH